MRSAVVAAALAVAWVPAPAGAEPAGAAECHAALDARGVDWVPARRPGIQLAVEIRGRLGPITWASSRGKAMVIDCSLAVSLAEAGRYLADLGIERAVFSSAYDVRNVRGTNHRSKHSFGLAVDVHTFEGPALGSVAVD